MQGTQTRHELIHSANQLTKVVIEKNKRNKLAEVRKQSTEMKCTNIEHKKFSLIKLNKIFETRHTKNKNPIEKN